MNKYKYIAIATKGKWWIALTLPTTKRIARAFEGCQCRGEGFEVVTTEEFENHKYTLK